MVRRVFDGNYRKDVLMPITKHGFLKHYIIPSEYTSWMSMRRRCRDPKFIQYNLYGGRGISVCKRWNDDFQSFISDMGYKPTNRHSLDRIDNNGNYEPSNCRWATNAEQGRNKNNNKYINMNGQKIVITDAAKATGISTQALKYRIKKWPEELWFSPKSENRS